MSIHLVNPWKGDALTACGEMSAVPAHLTTDPDKRTCRDCRTAMIRNGMCPACAESKKLSWSTHPRNKSGGVVNGRLNLHDVETIFYLACDYCSETVISRVDPDVVAAALTEMGWNPK